MTEKKITNIAVLGLGTIGKRHVMAIDKIDDIQVCGIIDSDPLTKTFCDIKNN